MKRTLALVLLTFALSLACHAQVSVTYYLTGAWWETKVVPGMTPTAGEMRITLYSDGSIGGTRDFNDGEFDTISGSWFDVQTPTGIVSKLRFTSNWRGEVFVANYRKALVTGLFNGGGYKGKFQLISLTQ